MIAYLCSRSMGCSEIIIAASFYTLNEVLRLLRMIGVPRLFAVVFGDVDVAETILNLQLSGSLAQVAHGVTNVALLSVELEEVSIIAGSVASHKLRELIPPAQRIPLSTKRHNSAGGAQEKEVLAYW
jgi:hypothetical protein